ncbi:MAG: hypothetical protein EOP04_19780, partial [Proteobacteria bacterium]
MDLLVSLTLAVFSMSSSANSDIQNCPSPLVGEWVLTPSFERIIVRENLATFHSKWGAGDIKNLHADRFMLTWYSLNSGKPLRSCQAIFDKTVDGDFIVWNPSKSEGCELGKLSRRSDSGRFIPNCKILEFKKDS